MSHPNGNIAALPKWAQQYIADLKRDAREADEQRRASVQALLSICYEHEGRYFIGIHGNHDVTDIVAPAVKP